MSRVQSPTVIVTYDDLACGGAADALMSQLHDRFGGPSNISVRCIPVAGGSSHRDAVYSCLQGLTGVQHRDLFVMALLKNRGSEDYRRIRDLCASTKPRIDNVVLATQLGNYHDVGLVVRNLVRQAAAAFGCEASSQPTSSVSASGDKA